MKFKHFIFLNIFIFMASACSNEKNTAITRTYHNVTSKYNVYYNANDTYKSALNKMRAAHQDDYSDLLSIEIYSGPESAQQISGEMDVVIQKSKKLIKLHSITVKPKRPKKGNISEKDRNFNNLPEYCKWVDDAFLLIGKANFYKTDYSDAHRTFDYILSKYPKMEVSNFARLWTAKTYMQEKNNSDAQNFISQARIKNTSSKELLLLYHTTQAEWFMQTRNFKKAAKSLQKAIELNKNKKKKIRWTYILAQLNQQLGNNKDAVALFRKVIKMNPPYEYSFNAAVNLANSFDSKISDPNQILKDLRKMLDDDKNIDYQDRIYYAMANIYMKNQQENEAVQNFQKSAQASLNNPNQKARSFLAIAEIAFKNKAYTRADAYYDSTMQYISADYKRYDEIKVQTSSLKALVKHLKVIEVQDSLLQMATMSDKDRNKIIQKAIAAYQEKQRAEEERQRQLQGLNQGNEIVSVGGNPNLQSGKWYFYNPSSISFGQNEFTKRWGNRKLADNWRRSNKTFTNNSDNLIAEDAENEQDSAQVNKLKPDSPEFYTQNIPFEKEQQQIAHDKIIEAYFLLSEAYLSQMQSVPDAVASLEILELKYPGNKFESDALFKLHEMLKSNNSAKALQYKNQLVQKYPQSMYAQKLSDPSFDQKMEALRNQSEIDYKVLLEKYQQEKNVEVINQSKTMFQQYESMEIGASMLYLQALAYGKTNNKIEMLKSLEKINTRFPNFSHIELVQSQIELLKGGKFNIEIYSKEINKPSVVAFAFKNKDDLSALKFAIENILVDFSRESTLSVTHAEISNTQSIIYASTFKSLNEAQQFAHAAFSKNPKLNKNNTLIFSRENFEIFAQDKSLEKYQLFFDLNYPKL